MIRHLLLVSLLAFSLPTLPGCGGGLAVIRDVAKVIQDITKVVDVIESKSNAAIDAGLVPQEVASQIKARVEAARDAIHRVSVLSDAAPEVYEAAVAELQSIWRDLLRVAGPVGVRAASALDRTDPKMAAANPGTVLVMGDAEVGRLLLE